MKILKGFIWFVLILLVIVVIGVAVIINPFGPSPLNRYTSSGEITLPGLKAPVTVYRDEKGMAYIYAKDLDDLFLAQGFVTAQDRLFQMELNRLFSSGRICELAGKKAKGLDIRMRTLGFRRNAAVHAKVLNDKTRSFLQKYVDGVNAFIETRPKSIHLEFKMAGIEPAPWSIVDCLTLVYFMGWGSAGNIGSEIIAQMLVEKLGPARAAEIFPLNINPDDESSPKSADNRNNPFEAASLGPEFQKNLMAYVVRLPLRIGSNNWAVGPNLSPSGNPIVANDPHLEANILPGPWYPCGLITPDIRAVGVNIAGMPGMVVGRTDHIAIGVTNAYGDTQDLYVETLDPDNPNRYLEGDKSVPFQVIEESLRIRDKHEPRGFREEKIKIRLTKRGPVISGILPGLTTDKMITVRWSSTETMEPTLGFERLLDCRNVREIREALKGVNQIALNFVFGDRQGNIGWQTTGKLPIRSQGEGLVPYIVKGSEDNWTGWIPWEDMPHAYNPARGWVGTCNHLTVNRDYPYHYSTLAAPSYRYRRLVELMDAPGKKSVDDHWAFQRDSVNLMAREIAPIMSQALSAHDDTKEMGRILSTWDFVDHPERAAPTIFHAVYREFAALVYEDELGEALAKTMLLYYYFWQERLQRMVLEGRSTWFDRIDTPGEKETRDDLFHQAALNAAKGLRPTLGDDPAKWIWGKVHLQTFVSPIRRSGAGKKWLGGGSHPAQGSGETLCRAFYGFDEPFKVRLSASLRMVADFGDSEKILAVLPGGITGRQFHPHMTDQIEPFMKGDKVYWWFSDEAVKKHARSTLILNPE